MNGRVVHELRELAELTGDQSGAQRLCWTETWDVARRWLESKALELPVSVSRDEAGNQWIVLKGKSESILAIGGHLDSVSNGGWLDGSLNVVAGLDVLRSLAESEAPEVSVALVNWADEEGARFGRSLFGSSATTGTLDLASLQELRDESGVRLPDALKVYGVDLERVLASRQRLALVKGYLELHIEQGPVLESLGLPLGVVVGTFGVRRHLVRFTGQAAHAGATPMADRRDAGVAGARFSIAAREGAIRRGGVGTVGNMRVEPGMATIVPAVCEVMVDQRHLDRDELLGMLEDLRVAASLIAREERVEVDWRSVFIADPVRFDPELIAICDEVVKDLTNASHSMPSGPLHDATSLAAAGIPTAMIFVRSLGGLSHCKEEDSLESDISISVKALHLAASRTIELISAR